MEWIPFRLLWLLEHLRCQEKRPRKRPQNMRARPYFKSRRVKYEIHPSTEPLAAKICGDNILPNVIMTCTTCEWIPVLDYNNKLRQFGQWANNLNPHRISLWYGDDQHQSNWLWWWCILWYGMVYFRIKHGYLLHRKLYILTEWSAEFFFHWHNSKWIPTEIFHTRVILVNMEISVILGHGKTKIQNMLD